MTTEQAQFMAAFFVSIIEEETQTNLKVLQAIPEAKRAYRPDEKSRSALELARHMPVADLWFLEAILNGEFAFPDSGAEEAMQSVAEAIRFYNDRFLPALAKVKKLPGEHLAREISLLGVFTKPTVIFLSFLIRHTVHHRGQLSTYLRPMGGKVPSIYGGSADEPFQPAAPA
jgi:uncharacterized damage-inducible protein DinB